MDDNDFGRIVSQLEITINRRKEIRLVKANAEIGAINREADAYYDGVYDAIKAVKAALEEEKQHG